MTTLLEYKEVFDYLTHWTDNGIQRPIYFFPRNRIVNDEFAIHDVSIKRVTTQVEQATPIYNRGDYITQVTIKHGLRPTKHSHPLSLKDCVAFKDDADQVYTILDRDTGKIISTKQSPLEREILIDTLSLLYRRDIRVDWFDPDQTDNSYELYTMKPSGLIYLESCTVERYVLQYEKDRASYMNFINKVVLGNLLDYSIVVSLASKVHQTRQSLECTNLPIVVIQLIESYVYG